MFVIVCNNGVVFNKRVPRTGKKLIFRDVRDQMFLEDCLQMFPEEGTQADRSVKTSIRDIALALVQRKYFSVFSIM